MIIFLYMLIIIIYSNIESIHIEQTIIVIISLHIVRINQLKKESYNTNNYIMAFYFLYIFIKLNMKLYFLVKVYI